jgi:hypothetical protein
MALAKPGAAQHGRSACNRGIWQLGHLSFCRVLATAKISIADSLAVRRKVELGRFLAVACKVGISWIRPFVRREDGKVERNACDTKEWEINGNALMSWEEVSAIATAVQALVVVVGASLALWQLREALTARQMAGFLRLVFACLMSGLENRERSHGTETEQA